MINKITPTLLVYILTICVLPLLGISCHLDLFEEDVAFPSPGTYQQTIQVDSLSRWFTLVIPNGYSDENPSPLLFFFHGGGGSMVGSYAAREDLRVLCEARNWILCFPNGTNLNGYTGSGSGWNAVHCCGPALQNNVDDVGFVETMIDTFTTVLNIDETRIYATGFSNGGMMTHRLAAEIPNRLAAVAPVASPIGGKTDSLSNTTDTISPQSHIPIIDIHGEADTNAQFYGGISSSSPIGRIDISFEESVKFWAGTNGCINPHKTITQGANGLVTEYDFTGCSLAPTVGVSIENLAHLWPSLEDSGYDGTLRIVQFLELHSQ